MVTLSGIGMTVTGIPGAFFLISNIAHGIKLFRGCINNPTDSRIQFFLRNREAIFAEKDSTISTNKMCFDYSQWELKNEVQLPILGYSLIAFLVCSTVYVLFKCSGNTTSAPLGNKNDKKHDELLKIVKAAKAEKKEAKEAKKKDKKEKVK